MWFLFKEKWWHQRNILLLLQKLRLWLVFWLCSTMETSCSCPCSGSDRYHKYLPQLVLWHLQMHKQTWWNVSSRICHQFYWSLYIFIKKNYNHGQKSGDECALVSLNRHAKQRVARDSTFTCPSPPSISPTMLKTCNRLLFLTFNIVLGGRGGICKWVWKYSNAFRSNI